jgi:hypothetical protein
MPTMGSNKDWLMQFWNGLWINAYKNGKTRAWAGNNNWVHP